MLLHKNFKVPNLFTIKNKLFPRMVKVSFWFLFGAILGFFFFASFLFIFYRNTHVNKVYSGVMVDGIDFGGQTKDEVKHYFSMKNQLVDKTTFTFSSPNFVATTSARQLNYGYDAELLAQQAYSVGRSDNVLSDISLLIQAYSNGVYLPPAYHYSSEKLDAIIITLKKKNDVKPIESLFTFENNRVTAFRPSKNGQAVDTEELKRTITTKMESAFLSNKPQRFTIAVPIDVVEPDITTDKANQLGIKELIGTGTSTFTGSIENRVFNISLSASRLNGVLIKPGEVFSFTKIIGDVSSLTGYKQAYVIENGKTVLGDGGGVCQVSTTLFRAALNAGLPIVERNPHAYRVGYYEQDSGPGIDAAIYTPTVDLKFKNDTGHTILVQTFADLPNSRLTFYLYGTKDNREVTINKPVILSTKPAPEPIYQDDPTLPKGQVKQVDFSANGASVYFTRTVKKDGKTLLSDKFVSNYRPWQAIYLRGTKE